MTHHPQWTDEDMDLVLELVDLGMPLKRIAASAGWSYSALLKRFEIPRPPAPAAPPAPKNRPEPKKRNRQPRAGSEVKPLLQKTHRIRNCMCCAAKFKSSGAGHRLCTPCRLQDDIVISQAAG